MGISIYLLLHLTVIDSQSSALIAPEPVRIDSEAPVELGPSRGLDSDDANWWLAFQTLAPAGGSRLGRTGSVNRANKPLFNNRNGYAHKKLNYNARRNRSVFRIGKRYGRGVVRRAIRRSGRRW